MVLYDITLPLRPEQPTWPGDSPFLIGINQSIAKGSLFNTTRFSLESHFATHIDAPYHFEENGITVDKIPMEVMIGRRFWCMRLIPWILFNPATCRNYPILSGLFLKRPIRTSLPIRFFIRNMRLLVLKRRNYSSTLVSNWLESTIFQWKHIIARTTPCITSF